MTALKNILIAGGLAFGFDGPGIPVSSRGLDSRGGAVYKFGRAGGLVD